MPANTTGPQVQQILIKIDGAFIPVDLMNDLMEAEIETSLRLPGMFTLVFYDQELTWVDNDLISLGKSVEIQLNEWQKTTLKTVLKGEITAIEPSFRDDFLTTLTVRGYDRAHRLHRGSKVRVFVNSTDSDIVKKIAGENGLSPECDATSQVYEHVYQDNQTDFEFLQERAEHNGFEFFVDDTKIYFRKPKGSRGNLTLQWGESLRSFNPRMSGVGQVNEVNVYGWDVKQKQKIMGTASSSDLSPQVGYGKWGGSAAQSAFSGAAKRLEMRRPVVSQAEAEKVAQAILDEINAGFIEAEGVAFGNPTLIAGQKVKLEKVGSRFGGTYMVTSARHIYNKEGYDTYFTVQGTRQRLIADFISEKPVETPSVWNGVVPALVTNIADTEKQCRVKLKFPWLDDKLESSWARVVGIGAGNNRGLQWIPEVNDEVLVAFEQGNFNRPFVIGGLWNGQDAPPEAAAVEEGKVVKRTLKTTEGHIIRLTDGNASCIEIIDSKTNTSIKLDTTNKKITITSKGDIALEATGNFSIKGANVNVEATSNLDMKGANSTVQATGNMNVKGATSTVEATGNISVKGAIGSVEASGPLTVKGALVTIN